MMSQDVGIYNEQDIFVKDHHIQSYKIFSRGQKTFILCRISEKQQKKYIIITQRGNQYICQLQQTLKPQYKSSLNQLIRNIQFGQSHQFEKYWFAIFKINNFFAKAHQFYKIQNPYYGQEIIIKSKQVKQNRVISNCFQQGNSYYYFLNNQASSQVKQIWQILNVGQDKIYGFGIRIGKLYLCLPFGEIFCQKNTQYLIRPHIEKNMRKVAYINYESSHCTGFLITPKLILTVRHLFNFQPSIGTIVVVRIYPFNRPLAGKIFLLPPKFIDLMLIQIIQEQIVTNNQVQCFQANILKVQNQQLELGNKVFAIGFGKFSYQNFLFSKVNLYLPTITYGVISKIITSKNKKVYFKTDCFLYNGYSGCPLWSEKGWIGNSVFIIKNTVSMNKFPKHNFNYSRQLISYFLENKQHLLEFEQFIIHFQKIHTRKQLKITAKL